MHGSAYDAVKYGRSGGVRSLKSAPTRPTAVPRFGIRHGSGGGLKGGQNVDVHKKTAP